MSLQQTAYIETSKVPPHAALQAAIEAMGFDCKVDSSYLPFKSEGFLPCVLNGDDSGFEIYFESAAEVLQDFPHLVAEVAGREAAITFRWGGDLAECACVLIVSAALASSFDAIVHYQDDDMLYSTEQLISEAKAALAAL